LGDSTLKNSDSY